MIINKIEIESVITIYRHDCSPLGFSELAKIELTDSYPDPKEGYQAVFEHHHSCKRSLADAAGFLIYPFAMPGQMIPGKTAHFDVSLIMTVHYDDGSCEELWLDFSDDPVREKEDIERARILMWKYNYQKTGFSIVNDQLKKVKV